VPRIGTQPLADQPLGALPSSRRPRATTTPLAARGRGTTGSHVPHRSPDQARATSMPDTTWPISRHPPGSIPDWAGRPVSMPSIAAFDTSSVDRSRSPSWPTPDALTARLTPRTLTTTALDRSSSGWFAASPCKATAEDHLPQRAGPSISDAAPHQSVRPSTSTSSRVRGTPCRLRSPKRPCPGSPDRTHGAGQSLQVPDFHAPKGSCLQARDRLPRRSCSRRDPALPRSAPVGRPTRRLAHLAGRLPSRESDTGVTGATASITHTGISAGRERRSRGIAVQAPDRPGLVAFGSHALRTLHAPIR
jgi:hypothetical protein